MLLDRLVRETFLRKTLDGAYIAMSGIGARRTQAKAQLPALVLLLRSA